MDADRDELLADPPAPLRAFIGEGRITAVPARHTRRRLLLDQVAQAFEPGRRYPEPVVNEILKPLSDDYRALRRYLVDEEFLSRTPGGLCWRAGGTVRWRKVGQQAVRRQGGSRRPAATCGNLPQAGA